MRARPRAVVGSSVARLASANSGVARRRRRRRSTAGALLARADGLTRTIATTAAAESSDATTSASGTETKFDVAYWPRRENDAASERHWPGLPDAAPAVDDRRPAPAERTAPGCGVCRPTIAPRVSLGSPVTLPSVMIGRGHRAERDGRCVGGQRERRRLERLEAEGHQHHRRHRHRRAEPGQRLQQRAERERDDDRLDPLVVADARERRRSTSKCPVSTVIW